MKRRHLRARNASFFVPDAETSDGVIQAGWSALRVTHEILQHRFFVRLPGGEGELLYSVEGPDLLDLYHAEVSPNLRGRGIAGALVQAACDYARTSGTRLIPSCPYVEAWFRRHPEQRDLLIATA